LIIYLFQKFEGLLSSANPSGLNAILSLSRFLGFRLYIKGLIELFEPYPEITGEELNGVVVVENLLDK